MCKLMNFFFLIEFKLNVLDKRRICEYNLYIVN
nr:MAG TPA: hypothetical protein [Caudoviricetes sp.]